MWLNSITDMKVPVEYLNIACNRLRATSSGDLGTWCSAPDVGACHNDELSVAGGAVQSDENGILFYNRDQPELGVLYLGTSLAGPRCGANCSEPTRSSYRQTGSSLCLFCGMPL